MNDFVSVLKAVLTAETGAGETLEVFSGQIYTSVEKPDAQLPAIFIEGASEEVKGALGDGYTLIEGTADILVASKRGESGDYETSKAFAEEYVKKVRQVLLAAGRLVTAGYPAGFLVRNYHQVKFPARIEYGYMIIGVAGFTTPTGSLQVSGRYQGTT